MRGFASAEAFLDGFNRYVQSCMVGHAALTGLDIRPKPAVTTVDKMAVYVAVKARMQDKAIGRG